MSDFKGTKGPWVTCDAHGPIESGSCIQEVSSEHEWMIAACCHYVARDEVVANARLIAAAPELLEALQETVKDLVAYQVNARHAEKINSRWEGCAEAVQPSIDKAREAIAKALGQ